MEIEIVLNKICLRAVYAMNFVNDIPTRFQIFVKGYFQF
jgi:hypothetical protein